MVSAWEDGLTYDAHVDDPSFAPDGFRQTGFKAVAEYPLIGVLQRRDRPAPKAAATAMRSYSAWPSGCRAGIKPRSPLRNVRRGWIRTSGVVPIVLDSAPRRRPTLLPSHTTETPRSTRVCRVKTFITDLRRSLEKVERTLKSAGDATYIRIHSSSAFAKGRFHKADEETVSPSIDKDEFRQERFARKRENFLQPFLPSPRSTGERGGRESPTSRAS
jgi:hypothetical protein